MTNTLKKIIFSTRIAGIWLLAISFVVFKTNAIEVRVPSSQWQEDVNIWWSTTVNWDENTVFDLIQQVNQYLWMAIWAVCMWVLVYSWFKLMTANWDEWETKKANNMLVWAAVWIVVSLVSYTLVRLVVNLF